MDNDVEYYKEVIRTYLGRDFLDLVEEKNDKIFSPRGRKISCYLLKFELIDVSQQSKVVDTTELFKYINGFWSIIINRILTANGDVCEINGSQLYAYFNASTKFDNVNTLLEQIFIDGKNYSSALNKNNGVSLSLVATFNFGDVIYSILGSRERLQKMILGKDLTVLDYLRVTSTKNEYDLYVTERVYQMSGDGNDYKKIGSYKLPVTNEKVEIYARKYT